MNNLVKGCKKIKNQEHSWEVISCYLATTEFSKNVYRQNKNYRRYKVSSKVKSNNAHSYFFKIERQSRVFRKMYLVAIYPLFFKYTLGIYILLNK